MLSPSDWIGVGVFVVGALATLVAAYVTAKRSSPPSDEGMEERLQYLEREFVAARQAAAEKLAAAVEKLREEASQGRHFLHVKIEAVERELGEQIREQRLRIDRLVDGRRRS